MTTSYYPVSSSDASTEEVFIFPLSFAQQRLWFLDQLYPGKASYNIPIAVRLNGELNVAALEETLREIVNRHEALRTTFGVVDGQPMQIISPVVTMSLPLEDLSDLDEQEREAEAIRQAREEALEPFNLSTGPLLRAKLLRLGSEEHVALFTMHHIISDAWSFGVFVKEVEALYSAFVQGQPSPLPDLTVQYPDFADWQREWLSGDVLDQQLSYWREQLSGASWVLQLPTTHTRPAEKTYRGKTHSFVLREELSDELQRLCKKEGVSLFMTLLAAFNVLLYRYTQQKDILIGSPIAGRNRSETEQLIGFFVNTLVLRTRVDGNESFTELLQQVRTMCLGAYAHQDLPFEKLVEELEPERSMSHTPLFQVMFAMQNAHVGSPELPGLRLSAMDVGADIEKFDLSLAMFEDERGLVGSLGYNTDLYDAATIERMMNHFQCLLESIVINPNEAVAELSLLTTSERQQLLTEFNNNVRTYTSDLCVPQLFELCAERDSNALAIVCGDRQITYGELNERANQLARHLRSLGVKPEDRVCILMERSVEMVTALLGALKAGAAYVPLDPTYPQERLRFMLEDARGQVLLTQQRLRNETTAGSYQVLCVDTDWDQIAQQDKDNPSCEVTTGNLAYVIYTSGSTGRPKGVQITHGGLLNLIRWHQETYNVTPAQRATQLAGVGFDASVWELWPYLTAGASLHLPSDEIRAEPAKLRDWLVQEAINISFLPTPLAERVLSLEWPEQTALQYLLTGGDQLHHYPSPSLDFKLVNHYGPTESTVVASFTVVPANENGATPPPIGRPITNTQIYLLDERLQLAPVGVAGELHIGGDSLSRGYLNQPALTAEKFIPNPFSEQAGTRLYRTGDMARLLPDGQLEFLGRRDEQVKVRGFRIELGEIESALRIHAAVKDAVVVAREDALGEKRLVAYVVAEDAATESEAALASQLREHLKDWLPEYMVPTVFVQLPAMPLNSNGKVDRHALPAPEFVRSLDHDYVAPRNPIEEMLSGLWREVLGVEQVGIHDNFFERGGHSLLATQLMSRVRDAFGVEVPLRQLFVSPTVAELAQHVEVALKAGAGLEAPPLVAVSRDIDLPLSFAQQRLWFIDRLEPNNPLYNIPVGIGLTGHVDVDALRRTFDEVIRRHESLRTTFGTVDGEPRQIVHSTQSFSLSVLDLSESSEEEIRQFVVEEARRPFDLSTGPLFRVTLVKQDELQHVLLLTLHHIVFDGWSMGVLVQEVAALYSAFHSGQPSPLPELTIQYADFAHWQRTWLQGEVLDQQMAYWREQLAGAAPVLELPTDRPRAAVQTFPGAHHSFSLSPELSEQLQQLSRREGVTMFMTLLAAFKALLYRYTQQADILVGSPIAGRNRSETEKLIGFFVNTLVLRTRVEGDESFSQLLQQVREVCLGAYAHQDVPFEKLVEELEPERSLSHTPLFQVMFALQNVALGALELPELQLSMVNTESATAKFDLFLSMHENGGRLDASLEYNSDLFDAATIARMEQHFRSLLATVVAQPYQKVTELPLLTAGELEQLEQWNETAVAYGRACLHELFAEQVERTPEQTAVVGGERSWSYRELNERANQIAAHLQQLGVKAEERVGICVNRSLDMTAAVLGVLKAGGAYVPLDPSYPQERIALMVRDSGARVVLAQSSLKEQLPETVERVVCLDEPLKATTSEQYEPRQVSPDNLAYVIYTSGSTGTPKGVAMSHGAIANLVQWQIEESQLGAGAKTAQFSSFSFDVSCQEMFSTWASGGTLVLINEEDRRDSNQLLRTLSEMGVKRLFLPPVALQQLAEASVGRTLPKSLKHVIAAGEQLHTDTVVRLFERLENCVLYNQYGPTETHVVTQFSMPLATAEWKQLPPIGVPIANTQVYVLDEKLQRVPVGIPGQLYLGGVGVARGYLNRPELTAERFIPDPWSSEPGARLYRTGDLARYLADGNVEFLGRADNQVKVRGFRIEPGEIESVLRLHPAVQDVVVAVRGREDKRLIAYVISEHDSNLSTAELIGYSSESLPAYMIPSAFVFLDAFPLTPSGKVDRKALPERERERSELESNYVAARNVEEELLAGIWSHVLHVERVGIHDNFFALGGHSLLATQIISRIRDTFGVELPLRRLFEQPTIAGLAAILRTGQQTGSLAPALQSVERSKARLLSFAQQRMWFINQLEPESPLYNISLGVRLNGQLRIDALRRTFDEVVRRHESLRTHFAVVDGEPLQVIDPFEPVSLPVIDLSNLAESERESEAHRLAMEESQGSFDLSTGPVWRATLLRLSEHEHVLLVTLHHIVSDGWSMGVLVQEVAALYSAFHSGQPSPLSELTIQYADFAHWQRTWLQGEVLDQQMAYWREQLAGAAPVLELPTDHPRPAVQTFPGAHHSFSLSPELSEQLQQLSRREGVTMFMTLLAAFKALLYRYTQQADILVGSPIAGRNRSETEKLIGFFVNTLVLRTRVAGDESFSQLLQQVREVCLGAYAHQDVPFEKLVEELEPERSLSHTPLFQVMFMLQNAPSENLELPELQLSMLTDSEVLAKFDLSLAMREADGVIGGTLVYNSDLFELATIERMMGHLQSLLAAVVSDSQQTLSQLHLLSKAERRQLLVEWNDTAVAYPAKQGLHELFEAQVDRSPEAVALIFGNEEISYGELNRRANQLAHYLRGLGVGPEVMAGVLMERSVEMVVSLLGILKAGGAYLPLDPAYPSERISFMLEDAGARVLLTQRGLIDKLPAHEARRVVIEDHSQLIAQQPIENPAVAPTAEQLAYVIYTSGSTGQPKGVAIEHRSVVAFINWAIANFPPPVFAGVLASTSICFDLSVFELFAPLSCGGAVIMSENALHLPTLPAATRVTLINTVPSAMAELVRMQAVPASVQVINLAGEALAKQLVQDIYEQTTAQVWNLYGPSETTTYSTSIPVDREEAGAPTIGRPLSNEQIYILDHEMEPVPVGVAGEIYIGGAGLARGYLNRASMTAEKFVPDPFSLETGARLYRTGDIGRYLANGEIQFEGRRDHQVKVRGFRIELGEIESRLREHEAIRAAAVLVRDDQRGEKQLVAYFVIAEEATEALTIDRLRSHLKERLPDYMVPTAFVQLKELPLTSHGKLNRRALPAPERKTVVAQRTYVAPRNTMELNLTHIWEELLDTRPIGVSDNFFELGGHSMLASRMIARIERLTGSKVPLNLAFQEPTIERLSLALRRLPGASTNSGSLVEIQSGSSPAPFFCVHPVGGQVLSYVSLSRYLGVDQTFYGFQAQGLDRTQDPDTSIEEMAAHYIELMRGVQPEGPYHLGGWSMGGVVAYEMARQLHAQGQVVSLLALIDSQLLASGKQLEEMDDLRLLKTFALDMGISPEQLEISEEELLQIGPEQRLDYILQRAQQCRLLPPGIELSEIRHLFNIFKINLWAMQKYVPQPSPVPLTLFAADSEVSNTVWSTLSPTHVHTVPGNHFTMMQEPHVGILAGKLKTCLDACNHACASA
jgi:amino acid adenylation domain-containing protein